jgi:hypothetical protein
MRAAPDRQVEQPRSQVAADFVADRVPDDGGEDHHDQDTGEGDMAEPGRRPGEQCHRLAGQDEAHEEPVLGEHDQTVDQQHEPTGQSQDPVDHRAHAAVAGSGAVRPKTPRRPGSRRSHPGSRVSGARSTRSSRRRRSMMWEELLGRQIYYNRL